jgi:AraC-like DNA-binding protein
MRNLTAKPDLDAYLRLNRAAAGEWQAAIRELLACDDVGLTLERPQTVAGSLSSLSVDRGGVCALDLAQDAEVHLCGLPGTLLVVPVSGQCDVLVNGDCRQPAFPMAAITSSQAISVRACGQSRLILLNPEQWRSNVTPGQGVLAWMAERVNHFLLRSNFFQDHNDACAAADSLFDELDSIAREGGCEPNETPPELDRRLLRVIDKIRMEPAWEFDLQELANHSGVSERNLYYLMKRETGMTPYRFYQRCRLIRVRRRLVDCQCDVPHISWYAADEGFSHLGRFAALYREHYGELPSETVQWRRRLQTGEAALEAPDRIVAS